MGSLSQSSLLRAEEEEENLTTEDKYKVNTLNRITDRAKKKGQGTDAERLSNTGSASLFLAL